MCGESSEKFNNRLNDNLFTRQRVQQTLLLLLIAVAVVVVVVKNALVDRAEKRPNWSAVLNAGFLKWQLFPKDFPVRKTELVVKLGVQ